MYMIRLWTWRNIKHIRKHQVAPREADEVVVTAQRPYPENLGNEKWAIHGQTKSGRWLQVIFVYVPLEDVEPDEFAGLRLDQRPALEDGEEAVPVIHAWELTRDEKRRSRR